MIHPSAIIDPQAKLAESVDVGPYALIGPNVEIGEGTRILPHAVLDGYTKIGSKCEIGIGVVIGAPPQDKKYAGARSYVRIGDRNVFREYVTIHRATDPEGVTAIGDDNYLMANVHVAHNCIIGNGVTVVNMVGLSGHITIEDNAVLGGMTAYHQHVRIGAYAMVGGGVGVRMDVVPFALATGEPLRIYGVNRVGLRRAGFSRDQQKLIKDAFRILFWSGLNVSDALARLKSGPGGKETERIIEFVEKSRRGLTPGLSVSRDDKVWGGEAEE